MHTKKVATDIKQTQLSNGVRVITERMNKVRSVALGFWLVCGSRQEDDENAGVAHLIEHMTFKGTERRSVRQIAQETDYLGGQMNAYTSAEHTFYFIKSLDDNLQQSFDLLSDMLLYPLLTPSDINKEKKVILQEYDMYADNPEDFIQGKYFSWIWPRHPLGRNIIGSKKSIRGLNRAVIEKFRTRFYTPDNLIIAVAGHVEHERVIELAERYLGAFRGNAVKTINTPALFHSGEKSVVKNMEQTQIIWGVPGISYRDKDRWPASVLNNILGGTASSRLFQSIREEAGLAYSIYSSFDSYSDSGLFSINAGVQPKDTAKLLAFLEKEIEKITENGITDKELTYAKEQINSTLLMGLESSEGHMQRLGKLMVMQRPIYPAGKIAEKIRNISLDSVNKLVQRLFCGVRPAIMRLGSPEDKNRN